MESKTLKLKELYVVNEITKILTGEYTFEKSLMEVLKILYSYMGVEHSFIAVKDGKSVKIKSFFGSVLNKPVAFRKGEGITGRVFKRGTPVVIPTVKNSELFINKTGIGEILTENHYLVAVPVRVGGEIEGVLVTFREFEDTESVEKFLETLSIIGNLLGLFFKLHEKLEREREEWEEEKKLLTRELQEKYSLHGIIGRSKAIRQLIDLIEKVSKTDSTLLLLGESGTGKSLIAKTIHYESPRKDKPFVTVNCAAIPGELLEAELFGYEKGAFTGAYTSKKGKFELANGGTIFLDEIGDMPVNLQAKLLRVLQDKELERLGSEKTIKVDVRIIAATNKDLRKLVEERKFREDLYYRLNVIPIHVPPLRERREDIPLLIEHFLEEFNEKYQKRVYLTKEAMQILLEYDYPGNVRELANIVERIVILNEGKVTPRDLPKYLKKKKIKEKGNLQKFIEETEKERIIEALEKTGYVKSRAAKLLGYTLRQLDYRIKKYGIEIKKF
ncbi:MAG TPA: AAA family ATPase [Aquifex aeolicus]|nr:AAA family ATPase [Aquifex aeolicus]